MSPSERSHSDQIQQHHLFWRSREWRSAGLKTNRVRLLDTFIVPIKGYTHDLLHDRVEPIKPPCHNVADTVYGIAVEETPALQLDMLESITDQIAQEAIDEPSYLQSDQLMSVAYHLCAQTGIIRLATQ